MGIWGDTERLDFGGGEGDTEEEDEEGKEKKSSSNGGGGGGGSTSTTDSSTGSGCEDCESMFLILIFLIKNISCRN